MVQERPLRILIIDDERTDREIYARSLRLSSHFRFEFAEAETGAVGVEKARSWRPDYILLDYNLPDLDGLELLSSLGTQEGRAPFPIVMLTAYGGETLAVQAMKAGVMDYLPKRQAGGELLARAVGNAIEKFQMRRQIESQGAALEESLRQYQMLLEAMPQMVWMADSEGNVEYANRRWLEYTAPKAEGKGRLLWDRLVHPEDLARTRDTWSRAVESGSVFEIEHRLLRACDGERRWHLVRAVPIRNGEGSTRWFGTCTEIDDQKRAEESARQRQKLESIGRLAGGIAHDFNNLLVVILGGASFASDNLPRDHSLQPMLQSIVGAGERAAQLTRQILAYAGKANLFVERVDLNQLIRQTCEGMRPSLPPTVCLQYQTTPGAPPVKTDRAQMRQAITDLVLNAAEALDELSGTIRVSTEMVEAGKQSEWRCGFGPPEIGAGMHVALEVWDTGCGMDEETRNKMFDPFFSTKGAGRGLGLASVQGFVRSNRGGIHVVSAPGAGTRFRIVLPAAVEPNGNEKGG